MVRRSGGDTNPDSVGVGEGFRWSWDEIKMLFMRNSNGRGAGTSHREATSAGNTGNYSNGRTSIFHWSNDAPLFRWSFEDLKEKVRSIGSSTNHSSANARAKRKRQRTGSKETNVQRIGTPSSPAPKPMTRRQKKTMREKVRRDKVKRLIDKLGASLGIGTSDGSGEDAKNSRVSILKTAIDEIREKKGLPPRDQDPNIISSEQGMWEGDDLDTIMNVDSQQNDYPRTEPTLSL